MSNEARQCHSGQHSRRKDYPDCSRDRGSRSSGRQDHSTGPGCGSTNCPGNSGHYSMDRRNTRGRMNTGPRNKDRTSMDPRSTDHRSTDRHSTGRIRMDAGNSKSCTLVPGQVPAPEADLRQGNTQWQPPNPLVRDRPATRSHRAALDWPLGTAGSASLVGIQRPSGHRQAL